MQIHSSLQSGLAESPYVQRKPSGTPAHEPPAGSAAGQNVAAPPPAPLEAAPDPALDPVPVPPLGVSTDPLHAAEEKRKRPTIQQASVRISPLYPARKPWSAGDGGDAAKTKKSRAARRLGGADRHARGTKILTPNAPVSKKK